MKLNDKQLAYFFIRILFGINIFIHGGIRLFNLEGFARAMSAPFEQTFLGQKWALPFAYAIPFIELIIGFLILTGIKYRHALHSFAVLLILLTTGVCILQNWNVASQQLIYALFYFVLIYFYKLNIFAFELKKNNKFGESL